MASLIESKPRAPEPAATGTPAAADARAWCRYFEELYQGAEGDTTRVPWARCQTNPALRTWLDSEAPALIRPGATACVVGCGLGDDVRELADRGYDVVAFDVSPTAVHWAQARHPEIAPRFIVADLFNLPASLQRRADLVVEINTLQAVHPDLRSQAAAGVVSLIRPRGTVLAICRGRDEGGPHPERPPFPLSPAELNALFAAHGLAPLRELDDFLDEESPPVRRLRGAFRRA